MTVQPYEIIEALETAGMVVGDHEAFRWTDRVEVGRRANRRIITLVFYRHTFYVEGSSTDSISVDFSEDGLMGTVGFGGTATRKYAPIVEALRG